MKKIYDIPHFEKHSNQQKKKEKSLLIRFILCIVCATIFFIFGYGIFFLQKLQMFISTNTGQKVTLTHKQTTLLPSTAEPTNQSNILLLGSDNDQKFSGGNPLTQTMMVVHIEGTKVDMFSIPRDLWVKMPDGTSYGKIDQAAEKDGIPSAITVVEQTFGIHIDHYAWVGLYGFIKSIDTVGGINLQVVHPVLDYSYPTDINSSNPYGYQRLDIQPGMQHMNGEQALQYVRSRHEDVVGDFGRTQRQRQLLLTLKETILGYPTALSQIPQLFDALNGQIKTDITPIIALQLGALFLTNKTNPQQYTLSIPNYSRIGWSTDKQSIVIGNATASAQLISNIFGEQASNTTYNSLVSVQDIASQSAQTP
ncbi:MAG TPA: LCP family protein [Candidatus Sulfotelmatobacter sp.]|jgi:LCP family protein required for cell wall assembly|nr:LCP family protein [Candidatus Sulfotelmatobacter sp.]